jgi:hypothetical protein
MYLSPCLSALFPWWWEVMPWMAHRSRKMWDTWNGATLQKPLARSETSQPLHPAAEPTACQPNPTQPTDMWATPTIIVVSFKFWKDCPQFFAPHLCWIHHGCPSTGVCHEWWYVGKIGIFQIQVLIFFFSGSTSVGYTRAGWLVIFICKAPDQKKPHLD